MELSLIHILFPILFVTVACGAVSGFHSLVSSGTSSKTVTNETVSYTHLDVYKRQVLAHDADAVLPLDTGGHIVQHDLLAKALA